MNKLTALTISFIFFSKVLSAQQNSFPILATFIETQCILNCIDVDSIPIVSDSSLIEAKLTINLFDTTNIYSIHVKFGTTKGGADLLNKVFAFDVSGSVGNGCTYSRNEFNILLGLGNFNGLTDYFSEVKIEKNDHSFTDSIAFDR